MGAPNHGVIPNNEEAKAWHDRACELAWWSYNLFFVRTDRYGGYILKDGELAKRNLPLDGPEPGALSRDVLLRHFRATCGTDVVGYHQLAPGTSLGLSAAADIDAHDPGDDPHRNETYAVHLYLNLVERGFRPLLATWGAGSFHLEVLFNEPVPGVDLYHFGRWLVNDANSFGFTKPVESFPKQAAVPEDGFGNWLRLVGRHHKRDVWASVFDGRDWLKGAAAVAHLLSLGGDEPALIPAGARPPVVEPVPQQKRNDTPRTTTGGTVAPEEDVFVAWLRTVTLSDVVRWHEDAGHQKVRETPHRADFTRAGKKRGEGQSFNVEVRNACPITFNFSTAAGLPEGKGLNPVQLRCWLDYGNLDTSSMAKLADKLRQELGWPERKKTKPVLSTAVKIAEPAEERIVEAEADCGPRTGTQIILAHFLRTYTPEFRRGNVIVTSTGDEVPMSVATAVPTSKLIEQLASASDAPKYAGKNGGVKHGSLPAFFKTWSKVAWGDLLQDLPDEDTADLGSDSPHADTLRRLVRESLLCEVTLGDVLGQTGVTQVERRSLISWCARFAKAGPWRSIRSKCCWCKLVDDGAGGVQLRVAIRHDLFAQVHADRRLREMGANRFTRFAARYGVGSSDRNARPHGQAAVVLSDDLVNDLIAGLPPEDAPGATLGALNGQGHEEHECEYEEQQHKAA